MSTTPTAVAILALFATSLLVRVLPVFLRVPTSDAARRLVGRVLPMAVFLNFAVYIVWTEVHSSPVSALTSIAVVGLVTFLTRTGLVLTTCIGTIVYGLVFLVSRN